MRRRDFFKRVGFAALAAGFLEVARPLQAFGFSEPDPVASGRYRVWITYDGAEGSLVCNGTRMSLYEWSRETKEWEPRDKIEPGHRDIIATTVLDDGKAMIARIEADLDKRGQFIYGQRSEAVGAGERGSGYVGTCELSDPVLAVGRHRVAPIASFALGESRGEIDEIVVGREPMLDPFDPRTRQFFVHARGGDKDQTSFFEGPTRALPMFEEWQT